LAKRGSECADNTERLGNAFEAPCLEGSGRGANDSDDLCGDVAAAAVDLGGDLIAGWDVGAVVEEFAREVVEADEFHAGVVTSGEQGAEERTFAHAFDLGVEREDVRPVIA